MTGISSGYNFYKVAQKDILTNKLNIDNQKYVNPFMTSVGDTVSFTSKRNDETSSLRESFEEVKEQQGIIGKAWDGFKNLFGMKSGSKAVEKVIEQAEKGEISEEEAKERIEKYKEGQKTCVDVVADIASGILAVGAFALAVPTGGASLAVGLTAATAVGAGIKVGIKATDAIATGKEYNAKDLLYDTATGAINGLLSPVTNGVGASITKTVGQKMGLKIVQEGAEEIVEQGVKQGIKQTAKSIVLNKGVDVAGGTIGKRAIALSAGMMADGAISGASDNMVRAALNGENVLQAGIQGAVGGAILSPVIGGGFRLAGKAGRALNNKITTKFVLPDGLNTKFRQGQVGDCALLSTLDGIMNNPSAAQKIKKSITKTVGGDYNVKIGDKIVKVSKDALSDEMLSDTTGIRIFEQAYKQVAGDIDGGFAEVVAKQFGLNPIHITSDSITDEMLDRLAKEQNNTVLSMGTLIDADGAINSTGSRHYFTIKSIDSDAKIVRVTSPYDTSKTIELSYDDVKALGLSIDGGSIKQTDLPNVHRSVDDAVFKGVDVAQQRKAILDAFDCDEETFNLYARDLIDGAPVQLDDLAANLELNNISVEDFLTVLKKHTEDATSTEEQVLMLNEVIKSIAAYKDVTSSRIFDSFKLSLNDVDEIYGGIQSCNAEKIYEVLSRSNSAIADEYKKAGIIEQNMHQLFELSNKSAYTAINADDIVDIGVINGQHRQVLFPNATSVPSVKADIKPADLIKSNMMTMDLIDVCRQNGIELPETLTIKPKPVNGADIRVSVSSSELMDRAQRYGIDSLSSHEIHALTDQFSELFENNPKFQKLVANYIKKNQGQFNNIYNYVAYLKTKANAVLKDTGIEISDHAYMRMLDRNLIATVDNKTMDVISFEELIKVIAENAKKGNTNITGYNGSTGISLILNGNVVDTVI